MGSLHISREETLSMSTKLLEGERALVTGCAGGIGRGIAKALMAEGATVLGSDITAPPAEDGIDFLAADLWQARRLEGPARRRAREARHDLAVRPFRQPAPAGGRHTALGLRGDLGRHDRHQPAYGLLPVARGRPAHARQQDQGPHPADHLAASRDAAKPAALQRLQGRHDHGDEGAGAHARARRHPR